jgi:hypothetical protein
LVKQNDQAITPYIQIIAEKATEKFSYSWPLCFVQYILHFTVTYVMLGVCVIRKFWVWVPLQHFFFYLLLFWFICCSSITFNFVMFFYYISLLYITFKDNLPESIMLKNPRMLEYLYLFPTIKYKNIFNILVSFCMRQG